MTSTASRILVCEPRIRGRDSGPGPNRNQRIAIEEPVDLVDTDSHQDDDLLRQPLGETPLVLLHEGKLGHFQEHR